MSNIFNVGDLVLYVGEPLVFPERWDLIVKNNNGIVSLDEFALILLNDEILCVSTLFFYKCQLEIPRIHHKFLRLVT